MNTHFFTYWSRITMGVIKTIVSAFFDGDGAGQLDNTGLFNDPEAIRQFNRSLCDNCDENYNENQHRKLNPALFAAHVIATPSCFM